MCACDYMFATCLFVIFLIIFFPFSLLAFRTASLCLLNIRKLMQLLSKFDYKNNGILKIPFLGVTLLFLFDSIVRYHSF